MLYKVVTGFFPFKGRSDPELFKKISTGKIEFPDGLSDSLKDLINNILQKNP